MVIANPGRNRRRVLWDVLVVVQDSATLVDVLHATRVLGRLGAALLDLCEPKLIARHDDGAEKVAPHEVVAEHDRVVAPGIPCAEHEPASKSKDDLHFDDRECSGSETQRYRFSLGDIFFLLHLFVGVGRVSRI